MLEQETTAEQETAACLVAIEVDGRQSYVFETDKLREMLGASRIIAGTVTRAAELVEGHPELHLVGPVSGEIRLWAPWGQRNLLAKQAWQLREWLAERGVAHSCAWAKVNLKHLRENRLQDKVAPDTASIEPPADGQWSLGWVHGHLGHRMRVQKGQGKGEDPTPTCSLFAPCRLHQDEPANHWQPGKDKDEEPRRELVSYRARAKLEAWEDAKRTFYDQTLSDALTGRLRDLLPAEHVWLQSDTGTRRVITYGDLADRDTQQGEDSYIAFLCADGDDLGKTLMALDWNDPDWKDVKEPWQRNADLALALDGVTREAYRDALAAVFGSYIGRLAHGLDEASAKALAKRWTRKGDDPQEQLQIPIPALPQLLGGDDLWTVASREVALDLAIEFSARFADKASQDSTLCKAIELANKPPQPARKLTMTVGIAFAKAGHPAHAMVEAAEALLAQAKRLRKGMLDGTVRDTGCVDWHWIQSSHVEDVVSARSRGYRVDEGEGDGKTQMHLTSRPWTVDEAAKMRDASRHLAQGLSSRKRKQLDAILRSGFDASMLLWQAWRRGLTGDQRKALDGLDLPTRLKPEVTTGPWKEIEPGSRRYLTPLLDLVELTDVLAGALDPVEGLPSAVPSPGEVAK